jgi:excisionase family DNA binding protein
MAHMHQPEHLTIAQAAAELGESRWTTQRRVRSGELPAVQHGGGTNPYLITRTDLDTFIASRTAEASA